MKKISGSLTDDSERNDSNGAKKRCYKIKNTEKEKLPHELIIEILSRLPTNNLLPLRFVSKTWLHLLTKDHHFAKLQFDRFIKPKPNPSILALKSHRDLNEIDSKIFLATDFESCDMAVPLEYPFYQATNRYRICGICNGLLCMEIVVWYGDHDHDHDYEEVYIWNPLINDHITISCLPVPVIRSPSNLSCTGFGFGFDKNSNVYKVVRFFYEYEYVEFLGELDNSWTQISVYTLGVDAMWRTVEVGIQHNLCPIDGNIPFVNGVLHWHKYRQGTNLCDVIVTFDLKEEVTGELMLPYGIKFNEIVELDGFLGAFDRRENFEVHVWAMKEYGVVSSWSMLYKIERGGSIPYYQLSALGFTRDGEILLSMCGYLILFNPETDVVSRNLKEFKFRVSRTFPFIGSIISPTLVSQAGQNMLEEGS